MALFSTSNYTAYGFTWATAGSDLFRVTDLQNLAQAVEYHDHSSTLGLPVMRLGLGAIVGTGTSTAAGGLGYSGGHLNIGDGASNHVLVDLDSTQTITGTKTFTTAQTFSGVASLTSPTITGTVAGGATYTSVTLNSPTIVTPTISGALTGPFTVTVSGTVFDLEATTVDLGANGRRIRLDSGGNLIFRPDITTNMQSMTQGIYITNAGVTPTGNPSSGGFLYVAAGALVYRGSSGTVSTIAVA